MSTTPPAAVNLVGAGIRLHITSRDEALLATCRDVLRDFEGDGTAQTNVWLWDFEPGTRPAIPPGETAYYLVPAAHLDRLRAEVPEAEGSILLKPVSGVVLRAFLDSAALIRGRQEIGTLRANRDEMLQHLLHANLRLQEYDQQRTNMIARALHDFHAPLTALSGFCGLFTTGELGPLSTMQREILLRMQRSTKRISSMAAAMFELSAGPRLGRAAELREADILEAVHQAAHEVGPQAREKNIEIRTDRVVPPPVALHFDTGQLEQVLVNLFDNACRFVPKHGFIEVAGYPYFWDRRQPPDPAFVPAGTNRRRTDRPDVPNSYRVDIRDNGPGVAPDLVDHIFEEYTSYSGSKDRSGGGLGLAICRLIISRHQGHVWAEANPAGGVFSFVLPLRQAEG